MVQIGKKLKDKSTQMVHHENQKKINQDQL